jgi:putative ABC transport system permease protein
MDILRQDLAQAARALARRPGFAVVAVLTLTVGIGGATAIFSVADAVVLRPLPYQEPERLVAIWESSRENNTPFYELSYPAFRVWRDHSRTLETIAAMSSVNSDVVLTGSGEPLTVKGRWVSSGFFAVLGVRPILGRPLLPEDERPGSPGVVVLSHALWRRRFEADPTIVGRLVTLDSQALRIVGVMPEGFAYPAGADLWATPTPWPWGPEAMENSGVNWLTALGRLKQGVSAEASAKELTALWRGFERPAFGPVTDTFTAVLTPLSNTIFGNARAALLALCGAVGLVLVIACANVAGLLVVHVTERGSEMAVRHALGATRGRLARFLLAESLLLAGLGGIAGVVAALLGTPLVVALSPQDLPRLHDAGLNLRALSFALTATGLTVVLCGLAPMVLLQRAPLEAMLRFGSRRLAAGRSRLRAALVVSEVALALVVLVCAGLLGRTFVNLTHVPLGFEPRAVLAVNIPLSETQYPDMNRVRALYQDLLARVRALPGVESAAGVSIRPLAGPNGNDWWFTVEGQSDEEARHNPLLNMEAVTSGYFRTMGIPVRTGRAFTDGDVEGQPGVVVLGESLARRCWPGQDPIGKRMRIALPGTPYDHVWLDVVGVVGDARYRGLTDQRLDFYMSSLQANHRLSTLVVRPRSEGLLTLAGAIRETIRGLDKDFPVDEVPMARVVSEELGGPRFAARLFGAFAGVGLFLAALGLYGLLAYSVSRRTREIGVRMALGAQRADVRRLVLGEGMVLTGAGLALGWIASLATSRAVGALLYGVGPTDPVTLGLAPLLLAAVAFIACLLPVRRAARVDPAITLRSE